MARLSPLAAAYLSSGLYAAAMGMTIPLIYQHLEVTLGVSATVIGLIAALSGGVQVAIRIPVGRAVDRVGEERLLLWSWVATGASGVFFLIASDLFLVAAAVVVYSLGIGIFWVAANALVARLATPGRLARTNTHYMVAIGAGFMVGPLLGGLADLAGFQAALGALVPLGLAGYYLAAAHPLPPVGLERGPVVRGDARGLRLGVLAAFYFGFLLGAADAFVPVHLAAAGYSAFAVGAFFSGREGVNFVSRLVTVRLVQDRTAATFLGVAALVEAAGLVLFARSDGLVLLALAAVVTGTGIGLLGPASLTLTAQGADSGARGRAMGRYGAALGVGLLIGPAVMGPVGQALGLVRVFDGVALLSVLVGFIAFLDRPRAGAPPAPRP